MATIAENLILAREGYAAKLADLAGAEKMMLTYSIGGRSLSWTEYQRFLLDMIKELDAQIASEDAASGDADLITAIP